MNDAPTNMPSDAPAFTPRIFDTPGMGRQYEDGRIIAAIETDEGASGKSIVIHEWSSQFQGAGHTTQALRWFREQGFTTIVANGVGMIEDGIGDVATIYWQHMQSKGLVDELYDDEGALLEPVTAAPAPRP